MSCGKLLNILVILSCIAVAILISSLPVYALYTWNKDIGDEGNKRDFKEVSLSKVFAETPAKLPIDISVIIMGILMTFIALGREIQIRVVFERADKYNRIISFFNVLNLIILVTCALGNIAAILVDLNVNEDLHTAFASVGFVCAFLYQLIHFVLTLLQRCQCEESEENSCTCMECMCKYFELIYFVVAWIVSVLFAVIFVLYQEKDNGNDNDNDIFIDSLFGDMDGVSVYGYHRRYFYEWISWWLINSFYFILATLFVRDPIDDELKEYFSNYCCQCCPCCKNGKGNKDSGNNKDEMEQAIVEF